MRALASLAAFFLLLTPLPAFAAEEPAPIYRLGTPVAAIGIGASLVVLAFLVNRFAPKKRQRIRRSAILALFYLAAFGLSYAFEFTHQRDLVHTTREVAELLGALAAVNLGALAFFELTLPAVGAEIAPILADILLGAAYLVAVLATVRRAGVDVSGILATSAVLTTITAISLQSTLSNVIGGVALQLDNSIKVGDWVQLESGKQGKVKEIRWRYTLIETRDWDTLVVPNVSLLGSAMTILGKRDGQPVQHRMWVYFNVDFRFSPTRVIRATEDALRNAPIDCVATDPPPNCICFDFSRDRKESFAYYAVRYWLTDLAKDDPTSSVVRERIYAALERAGIPLTVPGTQVWVQPDDAEHRERKKKRELKGRIDALTAADILKPLRDEELATIAPNLRDAPFAPGETITKQGAVAHWFYILVAGSVEVHIDQGDAEKVVARIDAPGFFGEMGLMTGEPRLATVVAITEVSSYRVDRDDFHRVLKERPSMAAEISMLLARRKIELVAARDDLDHATKERCIEDEQGRILEKLRAFFGLG